ncbi:4-galactosyl-N-acetylglucosaminide 3-alpha-L-fucosyltransferase FUT6-like [Hyperolius riggenbachi]|uniref:4-galactosyl-N-acetylglucosaminide 3-alpha-L-fucosyltransferase FUT6-like n=1 Tax=Hyperolius riggenbachi TaxID=752182 RepID=UPI0035A2C165
METSEKNVSVKKYVTIFIVQLSVAFIFFIMYNGANHLPFFSDNSVKVKLEPVEHTGTIILLWTWPFGDKFPLNECPLMFNISGCFYTQDRSLYSSADAVIMHHRDVCSSTKSLHNMPRLPNQYWVWFNLESPSHSPNLPLMNNLINLSMTYRFDSDIFTPYGWLEQNDQQENITIPTKTKLVAWAISDWNPQSRRVLYFEQLKNYLPIDVFGSQHQNLPRNVEQQTLSRYKFYLAFENSAHEDYITEKLWKNALAFGCVPIVLGPSRANYERFIPKDSFIHVDDFPTASDLAAYILKLDKDDERYQKYFSWRSKFHVFSDTTWPMFYCRICTAIKEAPKHKMITSLANWYK